MIKIMNLLKEFITLQVQKFLQEEEKSRSGNSSVQSWSFDHFKDKLNSNDIKERNKGVRYAEDHLNQLGYGSGRKAFELPNGMVLKVAYSTNEYRLNDFKGIAQNEEEIKLTISNVFPEGTLAKIEEWGPNKSWITMEKIIPFRSEDQFKEETGIVYDIFRTYLNYYQEHKPKQEPIKFINDLIKKEIEEEIEEEKKYIIKKIKDIPEQKEKLIELNEYKLKRMNELDALEQNSEKRNFLLRMFSLLERGADPRDLKYNHFGKAKDGQIKLFDYGLSKKIWDIYY